jgi:hypothetical protein
MENRICPREVPTWSAADTYDFANPIEWVKAIDRAMRHYFGGDNWLAVRNRGFPGLRTQRLGF